MMTVWAEWFHDQLNATGDGLLCAFERIEPVLHTSLPPAPHYLGAWPPKRHLWHVTEYERWIALPSMRQWLGAALPDGHEWPNDDATWLTVQDRPFDEMREDFYAVQQEQLRVIDQLGDDDWDRRLESIWGLKPLSWVVTKTYQHRLEHTDTLLRMYMRWRDAEEGLARDARLKAEGNN